MITVLRLGHRAGRDPRISTHCALVARAFGANRIIYSGEHDSDLEKSVTGIVRNWGGTFEISYERKWKWVIGNFMGTKVHLTMYGIPLLKKIAGIRKSRNILVIVGGSKVPGEVYGLADYNVSVTGQPHSEVAALAVFLHELQRGEEMKMKFGDARIMVIPSEMEKRTAKA
jgi:tRNA (cytidine56-2'-O)-methyltransferase